MYKYLIHFLGNEAAHQPTTTNKTNHRIDSNEGKRYRFVRPLLGKWRVCYAFANLPTSIFTSTQLKRASSFERRGPANKTIK